MAMPQRDDTIEAIKRLEPPSRVRYGALGSLLAYAVMYGDVPLKIETLCASLYLLEPCRDVV